MFFDRDFLGTPVYLLLYSPKCQGVPGFPNLTKLITFAAAPLVLTPFVRNQMKHQGPPGGRPGLAAQQPEGAGGQEAEAPRQMEDSGCENNT